MDVDDAHTHHRPPCVSRERLSEISAGLLCLTRERRCVGVFAWCHWERPLFFMLLRRLPALSVHIHPFNDRSRYTAGFWRVSEDDASALVQMRVQLRRKMDRDTVDENSPLRLWVAVLTHLLFSSRSRELLRDAYVDGGRQQALRMANSPRGSVASKLASNRRAPQSVTIRGWASALSSY